MFSEVLHFAVPLPRKGKLFFIKENNNLVHRLTELSTTTVSLLVHRINSENKCQLQELQRIVSVCGSSRVPQVFCRKSSHVKVQLKSIRPKHLMYTPTYP